MDSLKFLAVIPARYASTRFPGKPLARLGGEPVIRHVWKQVTQVFADAASPPTIRASTMRWRPSAAVPS